MKIRNIFILLLPGIIMMQGSHWLHAQSLTLRGHSHNDYERERPFFSAWENRLGSIEADIWAVDSVLYVAHDREEVTPGITLWSLYLNPVIELYSANHGKAWSEDNGSFQLLIDLKSPVVPTLDLLVELLLPYPQVFDRDINPNAVEIVISGSRPAPDDFEKYPEFIRFDGNIGETYSLQQLERISLLSASFGDFSNWNGEGTLPLADRQKLQRIVDETHQLGKKVRFWGAPDTENAWAQFMDLGIDFINTDKPAQFAAFCFKK